MVLAFYGIYAAAGLSVRFHSPETSLVLFWIGMAIMVLTIYLVGEISVTCNKISHLIMLMANFYCRNIGSVSGI